MRDVLFRVNWRKESKVVPELGINRVTTFAAIKSSIATVSVVVPQHRVCLAKLRAFHNGERRIVERRI